MMVFKINVPLRYKTACGESENRIFDCISQAKLLRFYYVQTSFHTRKVFGGVFYVVTMLFGFFCWCMGLCHRTESDLSFLSMNFELFFFVKLNQFSREARLTCPLFRPKETICICVYVL